MNNRYLPWNQLGIDVTGASSAEEALNMSDLNWDVVSNPIYDAFGNVINGYAANTRSSDGEVLGIVGTRYQIVQNTEAFDFTNSLVQNGVEFERAGVFHHGRAVWLLAKLPQHTILGDEHDPYIVFINSHDGTGAIKVCMVPIRIACSNALNFALKKASRSWSTRHMGNIAAKLEEAKHTLGLANVYMDNLEKMAEQLATKNFTLAQFEAAFDKIFPIDKNKDSERKIRNIVDMKEGMFKALNAPDLANFRNTAWGAINAVTDYIDHADPARITQNFNESRWNKIALGHNIVDAFFTELAA